MTTQLSANQFQDTVVKTFATIALAIADENLEEGDVLLIEDRANSLWDVVLSSSVTENGYNIVQCVGVGTLSYVLRNVDSVYVGEAFGINSTASAAANSAALMAAFDIAKLQGGTITLPEGALPFTSLEFVGTGTEAPVIIRGAGWNATYMMMSGAGVWGDYAVSLGDNATSNSGMITLDKLTVDGTNTTGEMSGVYITNNNRYQQKGDIRINNFRYGRGLFIEDSYLVNYGRFFITYCYQAYKGDTVLSCTFDSFDVELCGPVPSSAPAFWPAYGWTHTHSTLADTDPCVDFFVYGGVCHRMMIEACLCKTSLKFTGPGIIESLYNENDYAWTVGNKFILSGDAPRILSGSIWHGNSISPPNPRYIASMGDSIDAVVEGITIFSNAGSLTNLPHMVDFATSVNATVDIRFKGVDENLNQNVAKYQKFTPGSSKQFTISGQTFDAGMETKTAGHLLLTKYQMFPAAKEMNVALMQMPNSSLIAKDFTLANVGADSIMKQFPSPFGAGRCQKVVATGSSTLAYAEMASGTLSHTKKYYVTSWVHKASGTSLYSLITNNAVNYSLIANGMIQSDSGLIGTDFEGWVRLSAVHTFAAANTNAVRFNLIYGPTAGTYYIKGLFVVDLEAFDTDYNTDLASASILDLDRIMSPDVLSSYMQEYTYNAAPADGTYGIGDTVRRAAVAAGAPLEYVCSVAGTPGTWVAGANAV